MLKKQENILIENYYPLLQMGKGDESFRFAKVPEKRLRSRYIVLEISIIEISINLENGFPKGNGYYAAIKVLVFIGISFYILQ